MPLDIPDEVDVETTTYNNFKGVDMTNDASNIWKYRMAEGLNMAPDEAGQPWKRTGWEIAITKAELIDAFEDATGQTPTEISSQRVYYFELHSQDHMAYVANVRYGTTDVYGVVFIIRQTDSGDEISVITTSATVSPNSLLKVDANRCFFFEGNGTAGFYMFKSYESDDTTVNQMYIYTYESWTEGLQDVEGFRTRTVEPYVPTLIVARSPAGGDGTLLEGANMITGYRKVRFYGNGSANNYVLPTAATSSTTVSVKMLNTEGTWEDVPSDDTTYPWSVSSDLTKVVFSDEEPPSSPITGEDNVEITYESSGYTVTASTSSDTVVCSTSEILTQSTSRSRLITKTYTYSGEIPLTFTRKNTYTYSGGKYYPTVIFTISGDYPTKTSVSSTGSWGAWNTSEYSASGSASGSKVIDPSAELEFLKYVDGDWEEMSSSEYSTTFNSYSNTLNITLTDISDWDESSSTTRNSTGSSTGSETEDTSQRNLTYGTYYKKITVVLDGSELLDFANATGATNSAALMSFDEENMLKYSRGSVSKFNIYHPNLGNSLWTYCTVTKTSPFSLTPESGTYVTNQYEYEYQYTYTTFKYNIKLSSETVEVDTDEPEVGEGIKAFMACKRATLFGSGLLNAVFMTGSTSSAYTSRVWYSGVGDPTYFPDTNYIEAGSNDTNIMGMIRVGEYLGIIKQGANIDATIYLAYPTSYDDNTTYAIKQSITGVGAISNGAFNIISDDSLFLSGEGIMAVSPDDTERQVKNRSYFINKPLLEEDNLSSAVSFVYDGMYILCVPRTENGVRTGVCYVLDGSQKTSWANEKTNLQFEAYYWDNIPAQCFARYDSALWFADFRGNLCRFKETDHSASYHDDYSATNTKCASWTGTTYEVEFNQTTYDALTNPPTVFRYDGKDWRTYSYSTTATGVTVDLDVFLEMVDTSVASHVFSYSDGWTYGGVPVDIAEYGITLPSSSSIPNSLTVTLTVSSELTMSTYGLTITGGIPEPFNKVEIKSGVPIKARFATISDNDGATQYFKNMQKRGVVVSLLPKKETGATIYVRADEKDAVKTTVVKGQQTELPSDVFIKKKVKKYKRLQFVVENNNYDETFGVDSITKTYVVGNYAKNRG